MGSVHLARMAMASRFELILEGENEAWLRAAGEEALSEIERLDRQLTIFSPVSEVSRINTRAAHEAVPVEPRLFALLRRCKELFEETDGAFDVTVAPLMRAYGFHGGAGRIPTREVLARAREVTGMHLVHLDERHRTVAFEREGVMFDFGAIGKGYAVDEAIAILREAGVERAFLHGGTSTAFGLGTPEGGGSWQVALPYPGEDAVPERARRGAVDPASGDAPVLAVAPLENAALSVSAVWGRAFEADGRVLGHVIDPRQGRPVEGALMTAIAGDSATDADALSTALLVLGRRSGRLLKRLEDRVRTLLLLSSEGQISSHELAQAHDSPYEVVESGFPTISSHQHRAGTLLS